MNSVRTGKWTLALAAPLLIGALAAFGSPAPVATTAPDGVIHDAMEKMNGVMRRLRRAIGNEDKTAECLEQLQVFQVSALSVKDQVPPLVAKLEGAERDRMTREFRLMILETLRAAMAIEEALLRGDHEGAKKLYEDLGAMKKKGHDQFMEEEK